MAKYGSLPFEEQNSFFRRKLKLRTQGWTDIWEDGHDHAFVVAGAMQDDLVTDLFEAVRKGIEDGTTLEEFRKDFDGLVQRHGWDYKGGRNWRTRVIYETNLRTSYQAGRYQQLKAISSRRPYWQYDHSEAVLHPRPEHQAWDGLILRHDDPWWDTNYPPNDWGCQCTVRSLSERDLERLGKTDPDKAPELNLREVIVGERSNFPRTVEVPEGVDPGWAYAPGQRRLVNDAINHQLSQASKRPPAIAAKAVNRMLGNDRLLEALSTDFAAWVDEVAKHKKPGNQFVVIGALTPVVLEKLESKEQLPETATILVRDAEIAHMLRDAKVDRKTSTGLRRALSAAEVHQLPNIINRPKAVLWDSQDGALIYVFASEADEAGKVVVRVDFRTKLSGQGRQTVNAVRSGGLVRLSNLKAKRYELLEGEL